MMLAFFIRIRGVVGLVVWLATWMCWSLERQGDAMHIIMKVRYEVSYSRVRTIRYRR